MVVASLDILLGGFCLVLLNTRCCTNRLELFADNSLSICSVGVYKHRYQAFFDSLVLSMIERMRISSSATSISLA